VAPAFETVSYTKADGIAYLSLNRPRALNAYNLRMRDELYELLGAVADDPDVGAVVLRGQGRAFCAGADLTEFGTAPSETVARQVRWERDVWGRFLALRVPVIAALHGHVIGSGVEMALLCDLRIASDDALFAMPEVSLGLIPAAGGTQTLPRTIGLGAALELLLTGRRIDAHEALRLGLVTRVTARDALTTEVEALARRLLALDRAVVAAAKEAVWRGMDLPLPQALELEARLAASLKQRRRRR
jgi:enoyl-CoA hydratase/carnithine racemase